MRHASPEHVGIHAPRGETSTFLPLAAHRSSRPLDQRVAVVYNFHGHLIVALERLSGVRPEGFHFFLSIFRRGCLIRLKVKPAFEDDPKESFVLMETVAAEHAARLDILHVTQLIQHEIFEGVVFHRFVP